MADDLSLKVREIYNQGFREGIRAKQEAEKIGYVGEIFPVIDTVDLMGWWNGEAKFEPEDSAGTQGSTQGNDNQEPGASGSGV